MINSQNNTKRTRRKKRVPNFQAYFRAFAKDSIGIGSKHIPKSVFYKWSKKRFFAFKETHDRRKAQYFDVPEKHFSLTRDGFFLTYIKLHNNFVFYVLIPICLLFLTFLWLGLAYKFNVRYYVMVWNKTFPDYYVPYIQVVVFTYYYLSPIAFLLKVFMLAPVFYAHIFVIWYIHVNTYWNDFMERKLISMIAWRLGIGLLPALPQILNGYFFWGDRRNFRIYKHIFIDGSFFVVGAIWRVLKQLKAATFYLLCIVFFNIFK